MESDTFTKATEQNKLRRFPLGAVIRNHWRELIIGTFVMLATYVLF